MKAKLILAAGPTELEEELNEFLSSAVVSRDIKYSMISTPKPGFPGLYVTTHSVLVFYDEVKD